MNDRIKIINYNKFFREKFGKQAFGKSRKREHVFVRKLIVWFLVKEKGFKECYVAKILKVHHSVVFYYMKPVVDLEFERYYVPRARELKQDFELKFSSDGPG